MVVYCVHKVEFSACIQMIEEIVKTSNHSTIEDIEFFLYEFRTLKKKYGIIFYDRHKNTQALLNLEISAKEREKVLDSLTARDYYRGPKPDMVNVGGEYWEFGKKVKGKEVYIKISMGYDEEAVACFSFHKAERKIKYPYK